MSNEFVSLLGPWDLKRNCISFIIVTGIKCARSPAEIFWYGGLTDISASNETPFLNRVAKAACGTCAAGASRLQMASTVAVGSIRNQVGMERPAAAAQAFA